jgi:hypothetical protein
MPAMSGTQWLTRAIAQFLTHPRRYYDLRCAADPAELIRSIRKCDVLLVEGDQRVSDVIKLITRSNWSHAALYVGDELLRGDSATRDRVLRTFGDDAEHMVVEAVFDGVVASPLRKYIDYNIRVCRPRGLRPEDAQRVVGSAIEAIGWHYDLRNVLDLASHLVVAMLLPQRLGQQMLRLGSRRPTQVICTSLLGQLFHSVSFPVLPGDAEAASERHTASAGGLAARIRRQRTRRRERRRRRHASTLTPRDFDLSPYFEVVPVSGRAARDFDYRAVDWVEAPEAPAAGSLRAFQQG